MAEREVQKASQLATYEQKLATLTNNQIGDILVVANVSRPNNFNTLTTSEWKWLCVEIKKDFGDKLTHGELEKIISNGVKGEYDRSQFVVNGFTIYKWIKKFIETRPKQSIQCPKDYDPFYWSQMAEREQIAYIGNKNKSLES